MKNTDSLARILIVDDDADIRELLSGYFADFGIESRGASHGGEMRLAMREERFDAVILDLMLPGEDGLSLCRALRAETDMPIIILTSRGETTDRVVGLELGADDYVVKPFDPREMVARVRSVLRRAGTESRSVPEGKPLGDDVTFDGWTLNRISRQLVSPEKVVVPLSNAEFRLLWTFIERPNRVLNRDQLMDAARGKSATVFDRSIDLLVSRVRQKLNEDPKAPKFLTTVRGEGYMFTAKVVR